jgi:hypothetical protein
MPVLAIHAGDLHLRAAHIGPLDAPAAVEDAVEPARFVTPSIASLDVGGALLGYPVLMADGVPRAERVTWRYRRAALEDRSVIARDARERGLTSETFLALAAARLAADARGYAAATPEIALVVPDDLQPTTRSRLAAVVADCAMRPVQVIGETAALLAACRCHDGTWLIASVDDDALRLRVVARSEQGLECIAAAQVDEAGVSAVRARWLADWNAQVAALVPEARGFEDGDTFEFERLWQDLNEALDNDAGDSTRTLTWPLLRRSTVITLCAHTASLLEQLSECVAGVGPRVRQLLETGPPLDGVIVVGGPAFRRAVLAQLQPELPLAKTRCMTAGADAYARGGATLAVRGEGRVTVDLSEAPHALGVVGLGEEGVATVRTLVHAGQALPAAAQFTIVADRSVQKDVIVTLTRSQQVADAAYRHEFGPLLGSGVQRIGIAVEWGRNGGIEVRAVDRETGAPIPCMQRVELSSGIPLLAAQYLRSA